MKVKRTAALTLAALCLAAAAAIAAAALEPHGNGLGMRNDWLVNAPDYAFSEAYRTSVFYRNFRSLQPTGNPRSDTIRVAVSQLGYHEGDSPADYGGTNRSGSRNYVEYARLPQTKRGAFYGEDAPVDEAHYEWCAAFVNWCLSQARVDYAGMEIGCWKWVEQLKADGIFQDSAAYGGGYLPRPADLVFFNWKHEESENRRASHIGLVLRADEADGSLTTIEGNSDNSVVVHTYPLGDPSVIGYGAPRYEEHAPDGGPVVDVLCRTGHPAGLYVVASPSASLLSGKGSGRICRLSVGSPVFLSRTEDAYGYVTLADGPEPHREGYLPLDALLLMDAAPETRALTLDANGGTGTAEPIVRLRGSTVPIPDVVPSLPGDVFLGWSEKPYNVKVDFRAGDAVSLTDDLTLYAVWETRSRALAAAAVEAGQIVEFNRPGEIRNRRALLLGALPDLSAFTAAQDAEASFAEDPEAGRVVALTSTRASEDPFVTLSLEALLRQVRLPPVSAEQARFLLLRTRDVSLGNVSFEIFYDCAGADADASDRTVPSVQVMADPREGWQFLVFDLGDERKWTGDVLRLRLDFERRAAAAGETLYLSDLLFAADEAERDALLGGAYIFPDEPPVADPPTEAPTEPPTDPPTVPPAEAPTEAPSEPDSSVPSGTDAGTPAGKGCRSSLGPLPLLATLALALARPLPRRRGRRDGA